MQLHISLGLFRVNEKTAATARLSRLFHIVGLESVEVLRRWGWGKRLKYIHLRGRHWCTWRCPRCHRLRTFRNHHRDRSHGFFLRRVSAILCCSHLRAPDVSVSTCNGTRSHVVAFKKCVALTWDDRWSAILLLVFFCNANVEGPPVFEAGESLIDKKKILWAD